MLMWRFVRREGIALRNLLGSIRWQRGRDIFVGIELFLLISTISLRMAMPAQLQRMSILPWDLALDVTLKGVYLLSREVVPHMIRNGGGSIINIGSGWSLKGGPRRVLLRRQGRLREPDPRHGHRPRQAQHPRELRCPGDADTPMLHSECAQLGEDEEAFMREAANRPLARVGTPDDIANAVLFLASPTSTWITGAALVVDGGGLA
jgi:NAD(P)-dependent dehydrogenase (short-subunit alcohol dehydrogenase family)